MNAKNVKSKSIIVLRQMLCPLALKYFLVYHRYEETYFTRLPFTRQERHSTRQQYSSKALASELAGMGTLPEKKRKSQGGKKKGKNNYLQIDIILCEAMLLSFPLYFVM